MKTLKQIYREVLLPLKLILHTQQEREEYKLKIAVKMWLQQKHEENRLKGNLFYCKILNELLEELE